MELPVAGRRRRSSAAAVMIAPLWQAAKSLRPGQFPSELWRGTTKARRRRRAGRGRAPEFDRIDTESWAGAPVAPREAPRPEAPCRTRERCY
eukprot:5131986-Pyramimonas_sp.AAC.1